MPNFRNNGTGVPKAAGQHVGAGAKVTPFNNTWQFISLKNDNVTVNQECIVNNNDIVTEDCDEKSLKVIYTNTDQLTNKIEKVSLFLNENNIDIFCVCEVLPKKPDHNISTFIIQGYACYPCLDGRGVCLFVKNDIDITIVELDHVQNVFKPSIFVNIVTPKSNCT